MNENKLIINSTEVVNDAKKYWTKVLEDNNERVALFTDYPRVASANYKKYKFEISEEECVALKKLSNGNELSLYILLLSVFIIELNKLTEKNDLIVGIPEYLKNNNHEFVNKLLILKSQVKEDMTFKDVVLTTKERVLEVFKHQVYPISEVLNENNMGDIRDLLSVNFIMKNMSNQEIVDYLFDKAENELVFIIDKHNENINIDIVYNSYLFNDETITNFGDRYLQILRQALRNLNIEVKDVDVILDYEKNKILNKFNDTFCEYEKYKTIDELFEEHAIKSSNNIAVVFEEKEITYKELNERADKLATTLNKKGIKSGDIVGILVNRSIEMFVSIVATLKSGAAYLPIDPDYPTERIEYMLEDSKAKALLTEKEFENSIEYSGEFIDVYKEESYSNEVIYMKKNKNVNRLAYIIYTSGTTGKPKGVKIGHRQVVNFIEGVSKKTNITEYQNILCITTISFDMSITETLLPLARGMKIILTSQHIGINGQKIGELIEKNNIEVFESTPSRIKLLMESNEFTRNMCKLKVMLIGGDAMPASLCEDLANYKNIKVFNMYGPTETTVWSTCKEIINKDEINIGTPIQNTKVLILNKNMDLQPIEVPGELFIGGDGLSDGYLNNEELTNEKFIDNPYEKGEKIYKTGDLARWLPNGEIEHLGRNDYQVKIRGYRIELGEIETNLLRIDGIKEVAVIAKEHNNTKYLCAYYVGDTEYKSAKLREKLSARVPEYMVPSFIIKLLKLPTTYNGKVDRKNLIDREIELTGKSDYEIPKNMIQVKLVDIWDQVLDVESVGINDNFFELGGNSLSGTSLISRINSELNINISLRDLFSLENIKKLSEYIESKEIDVYESVEKLEEKEFYEVSPAQKRMYIIKALDESSVTYNIPKAMILKGKIDLIRFEDAIKKLIERHEALRTGFHVKENGIMQKIHKVEEIDFKLEILESQEDSIDNLRQKFIAPFDLSKGQLFRVKLVKLNQEETLLLFDMHHIISDALSIGVLAEDFLKFYNGEELEPLDIQYKEYSLWQNRMRENSNYKKQEDFWCNQFETFRPILNLPTDFPRPRIKSYKGNNLSFLIGEAETFELKKIARKNNCTLFMVLLSAYTILLSKYSGQEDVVVGIPMAVRRRKEFENMVGIFANTLPLVTKIDSQLEYTKLLEEIKHMALSMHENQDFQFEDLIEKLNVKRDLSREPLYDVVFTFQTVDKEDPEFEDFDIKEYQSKEKTAKFDLKLMGLEYEKNITFDLQYATELFKEETVEKIIEMFKQILKQIIDCNNILVKDIEIIEQKEKEKILYEFNNTKIDYKNEKTINELFEDQVDKTPENIAVVYKNKRLTYRELNEKVNKLARLLVEQGVNKGDVVSIMLERSEELIVGVMAILKAGAAYAPIDPTYPADRVNYIIKNSNSRILLVDKNFSDNIDLNAKIVKFNNELLENYSSDKLEVKNTKADVAYIIYTSGSTGTPKGVVITHMAAANTIIDINTKFNVCENDRLALISSICFDLSVYDIFGALVCGACVIVIKDRLNTNEIKETMKKESITIWSTVPALMEMFSDTMGAKFKNNQLRLVLLSGDWIPLNLPTKIKNQFPNSKVISLGGATEASIWSIYFPINNVNSDWRSIPYGMPLANQSIYILDKDLNILPIGVPGYIYIGGVGVANGYMNNQEKTEASFINHKCLGYIYKTGDMGVLKQEGYIEFLGRNDNQVKIRGYRIELGEIENCLQELKEVKNAIVTLNKECGDQLVAYYLSDVTLNTDYLIKKLTEKLPQYMIPSYFIKLESMPLTSNGKIDTKSLPKPKATENTVEEYEEARSEMERKLVVIWRDILGIDKIGINDNFFELGGQSLKATILVGKIQKELNIEISLREIFILSTIKKLSEYISQKETNVYGNIEKIESKEYYEASSAQKRMYMLQEFDKDSTAYNMPMVFELEGEINKNRIEETFEKLVSRHEALRTHFENLNGEIIQKIQEDYKFELVNKKENKKIDDIINKFVRPFDLEKAPLFRVELVETTEKTYLLIDTHHIISDGVSMSVLMKEFIEVYNGKELESLKLQYKDFAAWQNNFLKSEEMKKQEEYWLSIFNDEIPILNIPYDYERPAMQSFEGSNMKFSLDEEITFGLRKIAKDTGATMHMVLLSAFNILLSKYSGQEDIVVGIPIAGRPHVDLQNIMGMFVNTLALRNKPEGNKKYIEFLKEVKEHSLMAYENQSYQFEILIEKLDVRRDTSRNPLFDVMFSMAGIEDNNDENLDGLILKQYESENKISKVDLTLNVSENGNLLGINLEYCTKLFNKDTISRLSNYYNKVLKEIVNNPEIKICEIELLTEQEKNQILYEFNDTNRDYPKDKTIQELFEVQVEKSPNDVAIVFESNEITYRELNEKSNQLARVLRKNGVESDSIVGIMLERSPEMIIGIIGILKAGGAYTPIDPEYPVERIKYMIKDITAEIIITRNDYMDKIEYEGQVIDISDEEIYKENTKNIDNINSSQDLSYIMYTSGSTGNPKGVTLQHKGVINLSKWFNETFCIEKNKRIVHMANVSFDASIEEIFPFLIHGGTLYLIRKETALDKKEFIEFINKNDINIAQFVPMSLKELLSDVPKPKSLNKVLVAGDYLDETLKDKILSLGYDLSNHYGPTEGTVDSIVAKCKMGKSTIGKPIYNTKVFIVDKNNKISPIGVPGELCVAGDGLARGYLNREELTNQKFVDNPFEVGTKMYKTGDLARWLPDGNIDFLGRIDNQVKIRGFRIEPGEIENRLLQHTQIEEVAVVVRTNKDKEKYICAYVVSEKDINSLNLRNYLKEVLPEYMIPSYFVQLEKMPLNANGKLDRKVLPEPKLNDILNEYEAPRNKVEETLSKIWSEVLGIERIGINDNFFELGGHSLKATLLISKIHKELNREIPLRELFKTPTIKGLSEFVEFTEENIYSKIEKAEEKEYYDASSAQKRMYMLQELGKDSIAYNMPIALEFKGNIDKERIEETFRKLVLRHEALRTYFETIDDKIVQKIDNAYEFKLTDRKYNEDIETVINNFVRPFDLGKAPLFRIKLAKNKERFYLLIDMHHIISDGVSISILIKEFADLYNGKNLEHLKLQYKDFTVWQNNFQESEEMRKQEEYWINRFDGEIPVLNLLYDYERPIVQSFEGDDVDFSLDEETTSRLKNITKETGTTMHMVLLSAFNILLSKYSGQDDIVVGVPIAGRPHADLQNIIGMFVNTLALRNKIEGDESYLTFLNEVKENSLKAYEYQSYQLETLVEKLCIRRDSSRNPLFDVIFNSNNSTIDDIEFNLDGLLLSDCTIKNKTSKVDLCLTLINKSQVLDFKLGYCTALYCKDTIEIMLNDYIHILKTIALNKEIAINSISLKHMEKSLNHNSNLDILEEDFCF